ncbi:hypothetical protein AAGS40_14235 [Paraburkholderia sp. PREW-6R]|uniref:hypothetical protein n=1 Tax=Paraburkholderia sp. PREW-6R TaxID=3141544 RepID=UPI0031F5C6BC
MNKICIFLVLALLGGSAEAKTACDDLHREQSYPPLKLKSGTVCFVIEPVVDSKTKTLTGANSISLYYSVNGNMPVKAEGRGLLYDDTPGQIIDAFSSNVGRDQVEKIFVIHSVEVRDSLVEKNSSGDFYSIDVFALAGSAMRRDEHASSWFGEDYSFLSDGSKVVYTYPYQSKEDIQLAMASPFATLMSDGGNVPARVKYKTYLFDGPDIRSRTKKYLIEGDRATVEKMTAGWCQVQYSGGAKPLDMWLMCSALAAEALQKS